MADKKDFIGLIDRERDKHFWLCLRSWVIH